MVRRPLYLLLVLTGCGTAPSPSNTGETTGSSTTSTGSTGTTGSTGASTTGAATTATTGSACTTCGAACVDLTSDPLHCGSCERSCGDASCTDSVCAQALVGSGQGHAYGLSVDATDAYFYIAGDSLPLQRMPLATGVSASLGASNAYGVPVVGADDVLLPAAATILRVIKTTAVESTVTGSAATESLVVDGATIYAVQTNTRSPAGSSNADGAIAKLPKAGGSATSFAASLVEPTRVAVDADAVYWTTRGTFASGALTPNTGGVFRRLKSGGAVQTLASAQNDPGSCLVVSDGKVFFIVDNVLKQVPTDGSAAPTQFADAKQACPAVDADNVYAVDQFGRNVVRYPKSGGAGVKLTQADYNTVYALVLAGDYVYWLEPGTAGPSKLWRTHK